MSTDDPRIPTDLGPKRTAILRTALAELDAGVKEEPPGSNDGPEIKTYRPSWASPGPWCAWFASAMLHRALGHVPSGRRRGSVMALKADAVEAGLWRARGEYEPAPGDLFVMDLPGPGGHVGIVLGWQATHFETIEGNSGDRVRHGVRSMLDERLIGFICTVPEEPFEACWWTGLADEKGTAKLSMR